MILETSNIWIFLLLLPIVSLLYASVGHGGASGYLALMALFSFSTQIMKPTALLLNLCVAGIAFYHFYKSGNFKSSLFYPFALTSVPFAFFGSMIEIDPSLYKKTLGVLLVFAIFKMLNFIKNKSENRKKIKLWQGLFFGCFVGFFSGMIGIGGGIILTPIILLFHWGNIKEAAAVSALFIWVNSAAGFAGHLISGFLITPQMFVLVGLAIIGGFVGSYWGSKKINEGRLRYILAFVLALASIKLIVV
ncbi:MAG: sulfite exporter TauE/SafE family protein [Crocinitomicaceae bacterium]|nr:sulfite exporter TauE/SafE family protein [Crocinitomicaceae bacterium]